MEQYKFILTAGLEQREMNPINVRTLTEEFNLNDDDYRHAFINELKGNMIFTNENGDYDFLYAIENSPQKCRSLPVRIEKLCNGAYIFWRDAILKLVNGTWDEDKCNVEIRFIIINEYTCYEENKDREINLFDGPYARRKVSHIRGELAFFSYENDVYKVDDPAKFGGVHPGTLGWKVYKIEYNKTNKKYKYYYAREVLNSPTHPGIPWFLTTGTTYVRFPLLQKIETANSVLTDEEKIQRSVDLILFGLPQDEVTILLNHIVIGRRLPFSNIRLNDGFDNGMLWNDIIAFYFSSYCGIRVVSNFFQINPTDDFATTYPYLQDGITQAIMVFQKSDIKRPGVINNATKATTTLSKLIKAACICFNLEWKITDGVFRIEHTSYFQRGVTIDLTQLKYKRRVQYTRRYNYQTDKIPRYERFSFMESNAADFTGLPIEYVGDCVNDSEKPKEYFLDYVTTDIEFCLANSSGDSKKVSDEGLCFVSCFAENDKYFINTVAPILENEYHLNNAMGWAFLHQEFHKHNRLQLNGYLNAEYQAFITIKPIKKRTRINLKFCCDDSIDLHGIVNTEMGAAYINSARYRMYEDELELELVYPDLIGNESCLRPKKFEYVSRLNNTWTFNTQFVVPGVYRTEIDIIYPDYSKFTIMIPDDSDGQNNFELNADPIGIYRFRKRIICETGYTSPWTDYVTVNTDQTVTACNDQMPVPVYNTRQHLLFQFTFQQTILQEIEVEITKPDVVPFIKLGYRYLGTNTTILTVKIDNTGFDSVIGVKPGLHQFRFRRVCDAANGLYSEWSDYVNVNI